MRSGVRLTAVCSLAAFVLVVGQLPAHADAAADATKVLDRTLRCTTGIQGGAPVIFASARAAFGQEGKLDWFAQASVVAAGQPVPSRPGFRPTLAGLTAGWPPPRGFTSGGMAFHNGRCAPTRTRIGFSRRGLTGGAAGYFGGEYTCRVPRTTLVRIRAVFREPVELRVTDGRAFSSAEGRVARGQISIQALAKRPLVYADVVDAGRARLFTGRSCL
jgi:hypothetical protein